MGLFDIFKSQREQALASALEALTVAVQSQSNVIKDLATKVHENRSGVGELGEMVSFVLQQQNEITQHIGLVEAARKGKFLPNMMNLIEVDDDLVN